jgi:hypothetical protein
LISVHLSNISGFPLQSECKCPINPMKLAVIMAVNAAVVVASPA